MRFPDCFYTKAFWVVVPLLAMSMGSGIMAVNAQINANTQYDYEQDKKITDLTYDINEKLSRISANQFLVCDKVGANCK